MFGTKYLAFYFNSFFVMNMSIYFFNLTFDQNTKQKGWLECRAGQWMFGIEITMMTGTNSSMNETVSFETPWYGFDDLLFRGALGWIICFYIVIES